MLAARVQTQVWSHLLHQWLDELSLLIAEHVRRWLETVILVLGAHCEVRLLVKLEKPQNWESVSPLRSTTDLIGRLDQKNKTHSMNHAGDTHPVKMRGFFSTRFVETQIFWSNKFSDRCW